MQRSTFLAAMAEEDDDDEEEADEVEELDLRDVAPYAKISLSKAVELALAAQPGMAVEAGIEGEVDEGELAVFFEVMVVGQDRQLYEVKLAPADGKLLSKSIENGAEERAELREFREALRHTERSLVQMIASAEGLVHGQAVSAALEMEEYGPECEVQLAQGRYLVEVDVEGRAGHIVGIELAGYDEHEGGDADEEKGYDHEDHARWSGGEHQSSMRQHDEDDEDHEGDEGGEDEDDD